MKTKRSKFLDELGFPKTDLRKKYHCAICGVKITLKNWGSSRTILEEEQKIYCKSCYLKPEAIID